MPLIISPRGALTCGYLYLGIIGCILANLGLFADNSFFTWGPPLTFISHRVESQLSFYAILLMFFGHQLINEWVSAVVYPWVLNEIQDRKNRVLTYSPRMSLVILNFYTLYSQLDLIFIISSAVSQCSFMVALIAANFITTTVINRAYIEDKFVSFEGISMV